MKVLITGHEGFIGQNLVNYIRKNTDWDVVGWEWKEKEKPQLDNLNWVIHIGAISSTAERDVDKVMRQNLEFSQWLYKSCSDNNINLQYSSSASVYGLNREFKETSPVDPRSPYAWSKYLFDRWMLNNKSHSNIVQGFRYFNVYGHHEDHKGDQASPMTKFKQQAKKTGVIKLFKDSEKYLRDFISVEDICRVHVKFIKDVKHSGIWNLGTGVATSFASVASMIAKKEKATIEYIDIPENIKSSYQPYTCADLTKLEDTIGTQQWRHISDWLEEYS